MTDPVSLLKRIRGAAPRPLKMRYRAARSRLKLLRDCLYDMRRFMRYSGGCVARQSLPHEDAEITRIYHSIEKGLALAAPRPGFGAIVIAELCQRLTGRLDSGGPWSRPCVNAINALTRYRAFNRAQGVASPPAIDRLLALAESRGHGACGEPTKWISRQDIASAVDFDADRFFATRHSIRRFAPGSIDRADLVDAVRLAQCSPSVCNRQSARVTIVPNEGGNFDLLRHQNGNRGFGHLAQAILIVTADLTCFLEADERYQAWIDGGMFAMSLVLALHAKGYGTCCLNWSQAPATDAAFREAARLKPEESVIMLIAVGLMPERLEVANSERRSIDEVCRVFET